MRKVSEATYERWLDFDSDTVSDTSYDRTKDEHVYTIDHKASLQQNWRKIGERFDTLARVLSKEKVDGGTWGMGYLDRAVTVFKLWFLPISTLKDLTDVAVHGAAHGAEVLFSKL
ncbi:MAG: hypothetical protein IT381_14015 [Deltaproteobacteria bacterium]|nr:hypothetical protein [Deltaproteobacteria bacterium]